MIKQSATTQTDFAVVVSISRRSWLREYTVAEQSRTASELAPKIARLLNAADETGWDHSIVTYTTVCAHCQEPWDGACDIHGFPACCGEAQMEFVELNPDFTHRDPEIQEYIEHYREEIKVNR